MGSKLDRAMAAAQAKSARFHTIWMAKLDQMRQDHPDYPEAALMQLALKDARREIEVAEQVAKEQVQQANTSALFEHSEEQAIKRERAPRKNGGDSKNAATNEVKDQCLQALKDDPNLHTGKTNANAATILATRVGFAVNNRKNADADGRKDKEKGSLTFKTVAGWIGEWKRTGEI